MNLTESSDVVVIGAGLSGLWAARRLAADGAEVVVAEARSRVGGRTHTVTAGGIPVDLGGQFVCDEHGAILRALDELGMEWVPVPREGDKVFDLDGEVVTYRDLPPLEAGAFEAAMAALADLESRTDDLDPEHPWEADGAEDLDGRSVAEWIDDGLSGQGRLLPRMLCETITCAPPEECSLLAFASHLKACAGWPNILFTAQDMRILGGAEELARRVAAELGDRVRLSSPVVDLQQADDGVVVEVAGGARLRAARAISALPLVLSGKLSRGGPRADLAARARMGSVVKAGLVFAEPWWRDHGLDGSWISNGTFAYGFDVSPPAGGPGLLVAFSISTAATELGRRPGAIEATVTEEVARLFGPAYRPPQEVVFTDWDAEEWTTGGYAASFPPHVLTQAGGGLRTPEGRLHWAGAETSVVWPNFMDGAIRAAERAAAEVARARGEDA